MVMDRSAPLARIEAIVGGRVQGVGFRYSTQRRAEQLGLSGWVANAPDGTVRVVAEGPRSEIEAFVGWLGEGPAYAGVRSLDVEWLEASGLVAGFAVRASP